MIKLHDEFKESGFVLLAIDLREKQKTVKKFVEKKKYPFPYFWILMVRLATIMGLEVFPHIL